jgi:pimeloyl-ACP methyl ester carboxylesterase
LTDPIPFINFGGAGPILHFAHANAYPPGCYRQFIDNLLPHFRVLAIKQRPLWPHSDPGELNSWEMFADDLIRFFEQEGLESVIGVGHSLGGVATMSAAVKRPSLFRKLILIEPVFLPPDLLKLAAANPDAAYPVPLVQGAQRRRNRWPSRQAAFDRYRAKKVFGRFSDDALWDYVNYALSEVSEHGTRNTEYTLTYPREWEAQVYAHPPLHVWEHVTQIARPTLAIRGAESHTILPQAWQLWQELQPGATFVEIPDCGHMLPMERPSRVAQTIHTFLQPG